MTSFRSAFIHKDIFRCALIYSRRLTMLPRFRSCRAGVLRATDFPSLQKLSLPPLLLQRRSTSFLVAKAAEQHKEFRLVDSNFINRLHWGLQYEASKGLCDSQGESSKFSVFATCQFEALKASSKTHEQRIIFHRIVKGFQQYPRMKYTDRQSLMRRANSTVHGPHLHFFPPPALSNEKSEQMADRLASNSQVSSSSSSNGTSKEGRHSPSTDSSAEPTRLVDRIAGSQSNGKVPANAALEDLSFATFGGVKGPAEVQQQGDAVPLLLEASSSDETDSLSDESIPETVSLSDDEASGAADSQKKAAAVLRASYSAAASLHTITLEQLAKLQDKPLDGQQRTAEWHALRDNRLTASSFGNALGFWSGRRAEVWEEKLGIREKFAGNEATEWGTLREEEALSRYKELTGHEVEMRSFKVLGDSVVTSWLGASPDGLVLQPPTAERFIRADARALEVRPACTDDWQGLTAPSAHNRLLRASGPGILEIKCPYNRGKPLEAQPYHKAPWYYMPQVQGLMEIFDRNWCNLFAYTVNTAALYHLRRDPTYWRDVYIVLADFWWAHVIPAKHALARGDSELALSFRPPETHELTDSLIERSKAMVANITTATYASNATR